MNDECIYKEMPSQACLLEPEETHHNRTICACDSVQTDLDSIPETVKDALDILFPGQNELNMSELLDDSGMFMSGVGIAPEAESEADSVDLQG